MKIIGIDPGSEKSGVIVLEDGRIRQGYNLLNSAVVEFIESERMARGISEEDKPFVEAFAKALNPDRLIIVIEDVRPYNMRISDGIIQTIKFLGQLEWRLTQMHQKFVLIPRWEVKQWIFLQFKAIAWPEIEKIILRSQRRAEKKWQETFHDAINHGRSLPMPLKAVKLTPTFIYVEDRIIANAMRKHWGIQKPSRVGEKAAYGLKDHSWQALGLVSYYLALK